MPVDCENKELKVGDKVIVYTNFGFKRATYLHSKDINNRWVKYIRENLGNGRYCTQEKLDDVSTAYMVRLDTGVIKKISRRKSIIKV